MKTDDFSIGDAVVHISDPHGRPTGIVVMHDHARGLVKVKWTSGVHEWVTPEEIRLLGY